MSARWMFLMLLGSALVLGCPDPQDDDDDTTTSADDDDDATGPVPPPGDFTLVDGNSSSPTYMQALNLANQSQAGRPVWLYFAYSGCGACQFNAELIQATWDSHPAWSGAVEIWFVNSPGMDPDDPDLVDDYHLPVLQDTNGDAVWSTWSAVKDHSYLIHPDGSVYYFDDDLTSPDMTTFGTLIDSLLSP